MDITLRYLLYFLIPLIIISLCLAIIIAFHVMRLNNNIIEIQKRTIDRLNIEIKELAKRRHGR